MRLYIAGKQSVARTIALALSSKQPSAKQPSFERADGYFQLSQGDRVTWTGGHLLELADPEVYDPAYHQWRLENLPIIPAAGAWKMVERDKTREQLIVIRQLLQEATEVVHAGDPDREGQWMIDEVLQYLQNTHPVKRLLVHDLNIPAVRSALKFLRDNDEFINLSASAKARSRVDWLYGINMTRALTLLGRHSGYEGVLSVGRVQTSVLARIVKRDKEIETFGAKHYFDVMAKMVALHDDYFIYAKWKGPSTPELLEDISVCEALEKKVIGKKGLVLSRQDEITKETPILPFDLSALQIACADLLGYSAKEVMDICFQLYEKHHLISYPRSDCRYLPERLFDEAGDTLRTISAILKDNAELNNRIKQSDCWVKQHCWDNKKISTHHGIIPTAKDIDAVLLTEQEREVYTLIAFNYVGQFVPDYEYTCSEIIFGIEGEEFIIEGKQEDVGFWKTGDGIRCGDIDIKEKRTRPPERFTDASLMQAMDGLGTQATKALVIDALLQRGYVIKGTKTIFSSSVGRDLVHALPRLDNKMQDEFETMDVTDVWERRLTDIASGKDSADVFMREFEHHLVELIDWVRHKKVMDLTSADEILGMATEKKFHCMKCRALLVLRKGKHGDFWGCSRYPECRQTVPDRVDNNGVHHPDFLVHADTSKKSSKTFQADKYLLDKKCPECGKQLAKRKGKRGVFAGCSGYPACNYTEPLLSI